MTTNGTTPSAIAQDTAPEPGWGFPLSIAVPFMLSPPSYTDLPPYWSLLRDAVLTQTIHKENMWASAVARTGTKFAAHGYTVKDSADSQRRVAESQRLLLRADGGQGWVAFAQKLMQDLLTTDNGVFVRIRRADDDTQTIRVKSADESGFVEAQLTRSSPGAKIIGLYHLDSLRCMRTGNLAYPVRYQPLRGATHLLRYDQVLSYADMPSPRAELIGVGFCAASRAYATIATLAALRQMLHEFISGQGANKLAFVQGIGESTLKSIIKAGELDAKAKGLVYYLGTIIGALPGDSPVTIAEIVLKALPAGFDLKLVIDDSYLIYANAIGVPVQDIQPLSGQGLGTGTQSVILQEQSRGIGLAAFLKWWEQTVSDRILPATTELSFDDEHDLRDQQQRATVRATRATERATRITSGEISPAMARQLAADDGDLPQELLAADATPGGQLSDDEKPLAAGAVSPAALALVQGAPSAPPPHQTQTERGVLPGSQLPQAKEDALYAAELAIARALARWSESE